MATNQVVLYFDEQKDALLFTLAASSAMSAEGPLHSLDRDGRRLLLAWGATLAVMNACFYTAISRLPLATVSALRWTLVPSAAMKAKQPAICTA